MDSLDAAKQHLNSTDDPVLLVLRGHLLIEELLRGTLAAICQEPEELLPARLSFYQAIYFTRAVIGRLDEPVWGFVERLNEVRNRMAHNLDPGDLDELLGSVVEKLGPGFTKRPTTWVERFRGAVYYAHGFFRAIKGSVRLGKAYGGEEPRTHHR